MTTMSLPFLHSCHTHACAPALTHLHGLRGRDIHVVGREAVVGRGHHHQGGLHHLALCVKGSGVGVVRHGQLGHAAPAMHTRRARPRPKKGRHIESQASKHIESNRPPTGDCSCTPCDARRVEPGPPLPLPFFFFFPPTCAQVCERESINA